MINSVIAGLFLLHLELSYLLLMRQPLFLFPSIESFRRDAGSSRTVILMQYIDPVDIYIVVLLTLCTVMPQKIYSIN